MIYLGKRAFVSPFSIGNMWFIRKIINWLFRPRPTKLERETAYYKKFVQQIVKRTEHNRKRLEEMRNEKKE